MLCAPTVYNIDNIESAVLEAAVTIERAVLGLSAFLIHAQFSFCKVAGEGVRWNSVRHTGRCCMLPSSPGDVPVKIR